VRFADDVGGRRAAAGAFLLPLLHVRMLLGSMDFSSGEGHLDFWAALVDCRGATDNLNHPIRNSSFVGFEEDQNSAETLPLANKPIRL
jgi:hypothetical protein